MRGTFYTVGKLGPKQSLTPEGYLLCEEVAVARTGMMIYGPDETPIEPGPDGLTRIYRDDEEVFREETVASGLGKSVTNGHPDDDVGPDNWRELTVGTMHNVRRGLAAQDDLLLADLLVTDKEGIAAVQSGKMEVSLGYDADYIVVSPGVGRQANIIINHVALVDQGRCGPRCAIKDHDSLNQGKTMRTTTVKKPVKTSDTLKNLLLRAFKAKDASEVEKLAEDAAMEEEEGGPSATGDTHVHIHDDDGLEEFKAKNEAEHKEFRDRISALEGLMAGKAKDSKTEEEIEAERKAKDGKGKDEGESNPDPDKNTQGKLGTNTQALDEEVRADEMALDEVAEEKREEAKKAKDSAYLGDSMKETASMAEILAPGIQIPTFDGAARPGLTFKKICGLRRSALDRVYVEDEQLAEFIRNTTGMKTLDTKRMTCDAVRTLFRATSTVKQAMNNTATTQRGTHDGKAVDQNRTAKKPPTLAEINAAHAKHYANAGQ
jgi:hypothetical protein